MATKLSRGNGNLTSDENYAFFQLIGDKCQSLCSTLAQVYEQDGAMKSRWIKKYSGLLCFIKDNGKRSYYMRMYCLMLHKMVWEQEIYNELIIDKTRPFLLEFEGQRGMIALNFAFENECSEFWNVTTATVEKRKQKREDRKGVNRPALPSRPLPTIPKENIRPIMEPNLNGYQVPKNNARVEFSISNNNKKRKKISKKDIGNPQDFRHESHIGFDAAKSFGESQEIQIFLQKAGISDNELRNKKTKDVVEDFCRTNNVREVVRRESMMIPRGAQRAPKIPTVLPPELPDRNYKHNKTIDMRARKVPPIPTSAPQVRKPAMPGPPPPPMTQSNAPLPPPPPPMETDDALALPRGPVKQLPKVIDPRSDLLESIRSGKSLKKVNVDEKKEEVGSDALVNALLLKLQERRCKVGDSDSEEEDDDVNECDSDEWD